MYSFRKRMMIRKVGIPVRVWGIDRYGRPEKMCDIHKIVNDEQSILLTNLNGKKIIIAKKEDTLKKFREFCEKSDCKDILAIETYATCMSGVPISTIYVNTYDDTDIGASFEEFRQLITIVDSFNRKNKPIKDNKQYMEITHENRIIAGKIPTTKIGKTKNLQYCFFMIAITSEEILNLIMNMKSLGYKIDRTLFDKNDRFKDEYKRRYVRTATKKVNDKIAFQFTFSVIEKRTPVHVMAENDTHIVYIGIDRLEQIDRNQKELLSIVEYYNKKYDGMPFCTDTYEEVKKYDFM